MLKPCEECGENYIGHKDGKYCTPKCAAKNRPTQYQKMKSKLDKMKDVPDEIDYLLLIASDVDHALSGAYGIDEWSEPRKNLKILMGRLEQLRGKCA